MAVVVGILLFQKEGREMNEVEDLMISARCPELEALGRFTKFNPKFRDGLRFLTFPNNSSYAYRSVMIGDFFGPSIGLNPVGGGSL